MHQGHALVGEIDFAIVNPAGNLLLIEQKSGLLNETPEGLAKQYAQQEKLVPMQMARSVENLRARLYAWCKDDKPLLDSLLYCPDYKVKQPGSAGIDPARIVDASRREQLIPVIRSLLAENASCQPARRQSPPLPAQRAATGGRRRHPRRPGAHALHPPVRRTRRMGAQHRVRAVPHPRDRHRRLGQDPACVERAAGCGGGRPPPDLCVLQPAARRPCRADRARWINGRHLPPALRPHPALDRQDAGFLPPRRLPGTGRIHESIPAKRNLAVRRAHHRRGPGL